jgi:hypothetical protein
VEDDGGKNDFPEHMAAVVHVAERGTRRSLLKRLLAGWEELDAEPVSVHDSFSIPLLCWMDTHVILLSIFYHLHRASFVNSGRRRRLLPDWSSITVTTRLLPPTRRAVTTRTILVFAI